MAKEFKNPKALQILEFVAKNDAEDITAADIDTALDLGVKSINGIITRTFQQNKNEDGIVIPLMERKPSSVAVDGKVPKFIKLTDAGRELAKELNFI